MRIPISLAVFVTFAVAAAATFSATQTNVIVRLDDLLESYDYVVVGAGASGLTVANRLSENPGTTVLVIEAGDFDQGEDYIEIPGYSGGAVSTKYDWNTTYQASKDISNRTIPIPQGKIVGGSTMLNRMHNHRASRRDYDNWSYLGNTGWDWDNLLPFFKKSETFFAPGETVKTEYNVTFNESVHGRDGPIRTSYSPWFWPSTHYFYGAAQELGIDVPIDGQSGEALGALWMTHSQDPTTLIRSSARSGYFDPVTGRQNLSLLPNTHVTKLLFNNKTVTGIEYASALSSGRNIVNVKKETIMAAGAIHTPQILQLSGIGPKALLSQFNITCLVDLPVGYGFHDHLMVSTNHSLNLTLQAKDLDIFTVEAQAQYKEEKTGPLSTARLDLLYFLPAEIYTKSHDSLYERAVAQNPSDYLDPDTPAAIADGYSSQHSILVEMLAAPDVATVEVLPDDGHVLVANLHPFSRGSVKIKSANPFDPPVADAGFLKNPLDLAILTEGVKFIRTMFTTNALAKLLPEELTPGGNITSDESIQAYIRDSATTVFHPVGSCHMGAREKGGCVDAKLKVYGVQNLRVVDSSVIPLIPAAHIMGTVYALAEKASSIILGLE